MNLYVVLSPGFAAQPITGTPAKPTLAVRFKDGIAIVPDGQMVEKMLAHPGFGADFIAVDEGKVDPYQHSRQSAEPAHVLTEIKYGSPTARKIAESSPNQGLSPEIMKLVTDQATKIAMEIAPTMAAEMVRKILEEAKIKAPEVTSQETEEQEEVPAKVIKKAAVGKKASV
jgi:hypothetical protein